MTDKASEVPGGGEDSSERKGMFTSGIVSRKDGRDIALFLSGQKHAGENMEEVLRRRAAELKVPIQMADAVSRNAPKEFQVILANCLPDARRKFVDVVGSFPEECRYVLETLAKVYRNDEATQAMAPEERLRFHQEHSGPLVDELKCWMEKQIEERQVEPNSGLGEAIRYALARWEKLTRFLEVPGAPLDNNVVERALKKCILHRKNSLFYKTRRGAWVGDTLMSLIYTCELAGGNPFHYLTELQRHARELAANPAEWMPWNYRETLARLGAGSAAPPPPQAQGA